MAFVLGLAQCRHPEELGTDAVLEMAEQWYAEAQYRGVDLLVFPESLMTRYESSRESFAAVAEPLAGVLCPKMNARGGRCGVWVGYGRT